HFIQEGWYWVTRSDKVIKKKVIPCRLMDRELAVYRGEDGVIRVVDAFCPHMGAHLAEGKVEKNGIRCFFHHWRFDENGTCDEIPCLNHKPSGNIQLKQWHVREEYGLIWVWVGEGEPPHNVPKPRDLEDEECEWMLGSRFIKACHPHVVMINA